MATENAATGYTCAYCRSDRQGSEHVAPELMFGTRELFSYLECAACGSLQLKEVPRDLARHYPPDYYSLAGGNEMPSDGSDTERSTLRHYLRRLRTRHRLGHRTVVGKWLCSRSEDWFETRSGFSWSWFRNLGIDLDSRILDIGCGQGHLLRALHASGFHNLVGVDPFRSTDHHQPGLALLKRSLAEVDLIFDYVMFHHSLEHVPSPATELALAIERIPVGGHILVRLPVAGTYGWRTYGAHWFALDPPRHIAIPSARGIALLADSLGLSPVSTTYECDHVILLASEQYMEGQAWMAPGSFRTNPDRFPIATKQAMKLKATELNACGDGDVAAFVFQRIR